MSSIPSTETVDFANVAELAKQFNEAHEAAVEDNDCGNYSTAMTGLKNVLKVYFKQEDFSYENLQVAERFGEKADNKCCQVLKKLEIKKVDTELEFDNLEEAFEKAGTEFKAAYNVLESNDAYQSQKSTKKEYQTELRKLFDQEVTGDKIKEAILEAYPELADTKAISKLYFIETKFQNNFWS